MRYSNVWTIAKIRTVSPSKGSIALHTVDAGNGEEGNAKIMVKAIIVQPRLPKFQKIEFERLRHIRLLDALVHEIYQDVKSNLIRIFYCNWGCTPNPCSGSQRRRFYALKIQWCKIES